MGNWWTKPYLAQPGRAVSTVPHVLRLVQQYLTPRPQPNGPCLSDLRKQPGVCPRPLHGIKARHLAKSSLEKLLVPATALRTYLCQGWLPLRPGM
jgi:hypothetical protein